MRCCSKKLLAIDIKTTGIHPGKHHIVEISAIKIIGGIIQKDLCWQVCFEPTYHTTAHYKPRFADVADEFLLLIENSTILLHNAPRSLAFIAWELALQHKKLPSETEVLDCLQILRAIYPQGARSIKRLCKQFDIKQEKMRTGADTLAAIWIKMEQDLPAYLTPSSIKGIDHYILKHLPFSSQIRFNHPLTITMHSTPHCIEIDSSSGRLIIALASSLLDQAGEDLNGTNTLVMTIKGKNMIPNILGLNRLDCSMVPVRGVLLSHCNSELFDWIDLIHKTIPTLICQQEKLTLLIENDRLCEPTKLRTPPIEPGTRSFIKSDPVQLAEFNISHCVANPYLEDTAMPFIIETGGYKMFHTGNLRHLWQQGYDLSVLANLIGDVDCLLLEGTTLGSQHRNQFNTEQEVQKGLVDNFATSGATFVMAALNNRARLATIYRACRCAGKTLVVATSEYISLIDQEQTDENIRILFQNEERHTALQLLRKYENDALQQANNSKLQNGLCLAIEIDEIKCNAEKMVICLPLMEQQKLAKKIAPSDTMRFIFSLWQGYLEHGKQCYQVSAFPKNFGQEWRLIHTNDDSDWLSALQDLIRAINPKTIIPIQLSQNKALLDYFPNIAQEIGGEKIILQSHSDSV